MWMDPQQRPADALVLLILLASLSSLASPTRSWLSTTSPPRQPVSTLRAATRRRHHRHSQPAPPLNASGRSSTVVMHCSVTLVRVHCETSACRQPRTSSREPSSRPHTAPCTLAAAEPADRAATVGKSMRQRNRPKTSSRGPWLVSPTGTGPRSMPSLPPSAIGHSVARCPAGCPALSRCAKGESAERQCGWIVGCCAEPPR